MKSLLLELYKSSSIPNSDIYEVELSHDDTGIFAYETTEEDWKTRYANRMKNIGNMYIKDFGITKEEFKAMENQNAWHSCTFEWLNDPEAYFCRLLKPSEDVEKIIKNCKVDAKLTKTAWKKILQTNDRRIIKKDCWNNVFDPDTNQRNDHIGTQGFIEGPGISIKSIIPKNQRQFSVIVNTKNKTINFGQYTWYGQTRRPRSFSGRDESFTLPSGESALRKNQQLMKKIMGFLIKNDPRFNKSYKILGVAEWSQLLVDDILLNKKSKLKGRQPIKQRLIQKIQGMNVGKIYLFHGTSKKRFELIQRSGWLMGGAPSREGYQYVDLQKGWSEENIYFTDTIEDAENYASRQVDKDGGSAVVLKVEIPDPKKLVIDEDQRGGIDKIKMAKQIQQAGIPVFIDWDKDSKLPKFEFVPKDLESENNIVPYLHQMLTKEDYIKAAEWRWDRSNIWDWEGNHVFKGPTASSVRNLMLKTTKNEQKFRKTILGNRYKDWFYETNDLESLIKVSHEEGFGDEINKVLGSFPEIPDYLKSKQDFIEYITPWAEKWEEIAKQNWQDPSSVIKTFKNNGTVAYRGKIPAKNVEVIMAYQPYSMSMDPNKDEFDEAMSKTNKTLINRFELEQEWKSMKADNPKAKKTKTMKKWEKDFGYTFESKYLLKNYLL